MISKVPAFAENELVDLLKTGGKQGFDYLYEHYSGALYSVILSIVSDREYANDVLQETFVKIWKQASTYDAGKGRLYTWMIQIARNSALDLVRTKKYMMSKQNRELSEAVYDQEVSGLNPDSIGLRSVVGKMKQEHKELIELSYFQGFTQEEISDKLNLPLGTVKTRLRAALIQLRKMYLP
ncbi:MAG: RNA polymerase sigma factor [Chitinophagaceae bacterium]|jgi:RNA polymerase sigma-70 factor (ECF subfamily)|nr:RNA polymerase sigma factor [Chitinophagaceae bacterium]MCU0403864.1 RNA polymerase sigma factor [Chitinophagaceae bacterium]